MINAIVANIYSNGGWSIDQLQEWFPKEIVDHIVNTPINIMEGAQDKCIWNEISDGNFTVKFIYNLVI